MFVFLRKIFVNISMIIGVFVVVNYDIDNFFFLIFKKLNIKYIGIININLYIGNILD